MINIPEIHLPSSEPLQNKVQLAMEKQTDKQLQSWVRLFKTNNVISQRDVKLSNVNISNMPIIFVEKMWEAFAVQKLLSFFQQKI